MTDYPNSSPDGILPELATSECERELIHIPGAIQPHGALLAFLADRGLVTHASQNLSEIIGIPANAALGRPLKEAIGEAAFDALQGPWSDVGGAVTKQYSIQGPKSSILHLRAHRSGHRICVDIEPAGLESKDALPVGTVQAVIETFKHLVGLTNLCEVAVRGLKNITGFDRVMAYRFDKDGHGEVIAEACDPRFESFLGLHYPAADIPPQARRQYLLQRVGTIANSSYEPVQLLSDISIDDGTPLDLSLSALRSVSPVHRQYMRNMKTAASLTIGLVHEECLWGMLICHHGTSRVVGPEMRAAADMIGQVVSLLIASVGKAEALSEQMRRNGTMRELVKRLAEPVPLLDALAAGQKQLLDLVDARGAVVRLAGTVRRIGHVPSLAAAKQALAILAPIAVDKVLAVDDLGIRYPQLVECTSKGSGALFLPLGQDDAILWFRPEQARTVTWGGNPTAHVTSDPITGKISPRLSFAGWKDAVRGRSEPWKVADISIARDLRSAIEAAVAQCTKIELIELQQRYQLDQWAQNARLKTALENIGAGVAMYDADQRLVVCNSRFGSLYNLPEDLQQPGTRFQDIVRYRMTSGILDASAISLTVKKEVGQFIEDLSADTVSSRNELLSNGRLICVTRRQLPEGGWLKTHEDITDRNHHEARIVHLAHHDPLTGLANRSLFKQNMAKAERGLRDDEQPFAILMLDLDRFKTINDSLGHAAGDSLLRQAAQRLSSALRSVDTLARLGGDEFAIIQSPPRDPSLGPRERAIVLANRIADELTKPFEIDGHSIVIGTSIGIALALDESDPEELLKRADLALYEAKSAGRGCYRFFDPRMTFVADKAQQLEADMRRALESGEFELRYQPIIDLANNRVGGVEALVRWQHPTLGLVSPADFIPLAEATGLIVPLGAWVIQQACRDASHFPGHIKVAINLSAVQFRKSDLLDTMLCAMVDAGLPAARLEIEVTESVLLDKDTSCLTLLHQLKGMGVSIALDDFGTGYSSLSYLKVFPFDKIKIDRSFIKDMLERDDCAAIVRSVIELGRSLNMTTTAEGVETELQFEMLRAAGATFAQGYLFGRPVQKYALDFGKLGCLKASVAEQAA